MEREQNVPAGVEERWRKAMLEKGGEEIEVGEILKWSVGAELHGTFLAMKQSSKYPDSPLLEVESDTDGYQIWGCPTILKNRLTRVKPGQHIDILCRGKTKVENRGVLAWDFVVVVRDA